MENTTATTREQLQDLMFKALAHMGRGADAHKRPYDYKELKDTCKC